MSVVPLTLGSRRKPYDEVNKRFSGLSNQTLPNTQCEKRGWWVIIGNFITASDFKFIENDKCYSNDLLNVWKGLHLAKEA